MGSFGFSWIFFCKSPPPHPTSSLSGTDGDQKFWVPPHQKFREKTLEVPHVQYFWKILLTHTWASCRVDSHAHRVDLLFIYTGNWILLLTLNELITQIKKQKVCLCPIWIRWTTVYSLCVREMRQNNALPWEFYKGSLFQKFFYTRRFLFCKNFYCERLIFSHGSLWKFINIKLFFLSWRVVIPKFFLIPKGHFSKRTLFQKVFIP